MDSTGGKRLRLDHDAPTSNPKQAAAASRVGVSKGARSALGHDQGGEADNLSALWISVFSSVAIID
jgi:hypothetical protein